MIRTFDTDDGDDDDAAAAPPSVNTARSGSGAGTGETRRRRQPAVAFSELRSSLSSRPARSAAGRTPRRKRKAPDDVAVAFDDDDDDAADDAAARAQHETIPCVYPLNAQAEQRLRDNSRSELFHDTDSEREDDADADSDDDQDEAETKRKKKSESTDPGGVSQTCYLCDEMHDEERVQRYLDMICEMSNKKSYERIANDVSKMYEEERAEFNHQIKEEIEALRHNPQRQGRADTMACDVARLKTELMHRLTPYHVYVHIRDHTQDVVMRTRHLLGTITVIADHVTRNGLFRIPTSLRDVSPYEISTSDVIIDSEQLTKFTNCVRSMTIVTKTLEQFFKARPQSESTSRVSGGGASGVAGAKHVGSSSIKPSPAKRPRVHQSFAPSSASAGRPGLPAVSPSLRFVSKRIAPAAIAGDAEQGFRPALRAPGRSPLHDASPPGPGARGRSRDYDDQDPDEEAGSGSGSGSGSALTSPVPVRNDRARFGSGIGELIAARRTTPSGDSF